MVSHSTPRVDLNLTPLLDVVFQLIMFFMITVNFVSEQINQNVLLPESRSAQEIMAKGETDILVINIEVVRQDRRGPDGQIMRDPHGRPLREIVVPKRTRIVFAGAEEIQFAEAEERKGLADAQRVLQQLAQQFRLDESRREKKPIDAVKKLPQPVVIRADADTNYGLVFPLIRQCNKEGFAKVELRAQSRK